MTKHPQTACDLQQTQLINALRSLILASHELRQAIAHQLQLTVTETLLLSHLAHAHTLTAKQLADRCGLAPSTITGLCDRLVHADLIRRTTEPGNRRALSISLTKHGHEMVTYATSFTAAAAAGLGPAEHTTRTLTTLAEALRTQTAALTIDDLHNA